MKAFAVLAILAGALLFITRRRTADARLRSMREAGL